LLTSLLFLGFKCQAQLDTNREVQIGYSPWARERFVNDALRLLFFRTLKTTPSRKMAFSDSFSVSYRYQLRSKFSIGPTGQLTPFGIRYGKNTGAFAEIGWGYKGILNLGVSAKF
jgi:hypothetical protein